MGKLRGRDITVSYFLQRNAVGTATRYGLDGPGIESGGARFSVSVVTDPEAHPASCTVQGVVQLVPGLSRC